MRGRLLFGVVCFAAAGLLLAWTPAVGQSSAQSKPAVDQRSNEPAKPNANADALVLQDFKKRIDAYMDLHDKMKKGPVPLKQTTDPAEIKTAQETLSGKIRAARADAKPGDIFTPEIQTRFRQLLHPELKGPAGSDARKVLKDDAPPAVPLKVNALYPAGASFPSVPSSLLLNLPTLPKGLEYRIVDKHLILRDADANIIVDFIPNAIT